MSVNDSEWMIHSPMSYFRLSKNRMFVPRRESVEETTAMLLMDSMIFPTVGEIFKSNLSSMQNEIRLEHPLRSVAESDRNFDRAVPICCIYFNRRSGPFQNWSYYLKLLTLFPRECRVITSLHSLTRFPSPKHHACGQGASLKKTSNLELFANDNAFSRPSTLVKVYRAFFRYAHS